MVTAGPAVTVHPHPHPHPRPVPAPGSRLPALLVLAAIIGLGILAYRQTVVRLGDECTHGHWGIPIVACSAAGAALMRGLRPNGPDIHDRQVDVIVGLPLLALAALMTTVTQSRSPLGYSRAGLDTVSLALWAAGVIALVGGVRVLGRVSEPLILAAAAVPAATAAGGFGTATGLIAGAVLVGRAQLADRRRRRRRSRMTASTHGETDHGSTRDRWSWRRGASWPALVVIASVSAVIGVFGSCTGGA